MALLAGVSSAAQESTTADWHSDVRIGGIGGLYLLPEPGELWVEIEKADLNHTAAPAHLRAILFGPDRSVLDEQWIPDDGGAKGAPGPVQRVRLSTTVERTGVYGVNITVTNDRYGNELAWGFRTNCPKYLIETSRGHRDAPHEEPLVLLNPSAPGNVVFILGEGAFAIEATGVPARTPGLEVFHPDGAEIASLTVTNGDASGRFDNPAGETRPWRLHLPAFAAQIHIDGVTRWTESDRFNNFSLWTTDIDSWFPLHRYRWLLTPYHRTVYSDSNSDNTVTLQIHNNDTTEHTITLSVDMPDDAIGRASVPAMRDLTDSPRDDAGLWASVPTPEVIVPPGKTIPVTLTYQLPDHGNEWTCYLRATPDDDPFMSTFSRFTLRRGRAPAYDPLDMPVVLKPYAHENKQFGYLPDYPLTGQPYFDINNQPVIADKRAFHVRRGGVWTSIANAREPGGHTAPFELLSTKVAFDSKNAAYLLARQGGKPVLLQLPDGTAVPTAYPVTGGGSLDIEPFSGHNQPQGPPPFARFTLTEKDPDLFWRRLHDLHLFVPKKNADGTLAIGEPVLVSQKCIGFSGHSGTPSTLVSRDGNVHIVWAEATEPKEKVDGVPTFVATYDTETGTLGKPALVGYGPPANDVHNTPSITMDSEDYLHVLVGTHGRTFRYARSLTPNDASGGWTDPVELGPGLRQTYVGLVCDKNDTLHVVFRLWQNDTTYFPAGNYACLAYMTKPKDGEWSAPRPLIVSPFSEYSVFYHRLTIDRESRLYLSYDYWTTHWFYRTDHFGDRRALLMSPDGGQTWRFAKE